MWRKYLVLTSKHFILSIQYRAELLTWVILNVVPALVLVWIWQGVYSQSSQIAGMSLGQVVQYYLLTVVVQAVIASHFETRSAENIRLGKIDHYLTKPLAYPFRIFFSHLGGKIYFLTVSLPALALVYMALANTFHFQAAFSIHQLISLLVLLGLGFMIEFFLAMIIVLLAFWLDQPEGLQHFKWIIITLFSGMMIPFPFMPDWLRQISMTLPLKYLYAIPISIFQGTYQLTWNDIYYESLVVLVLTILVSWMWKQAAYRYSSAGG